MKDNIHIENIHKAMSKFYDISGMSLEDAKHIISGIEDDLIAVLPEYQQRDDDYRLGNDTYGYGDDGKASAVDMESGILYNLMYISDRWGGAFRIAWILGIVNENYR